MRPIVRKLNHTAVEHAYYARKFDIFLKFETSEFTTTGCEVLNLTPGPGVTVHMYFPVKFCVQNVKPINLVLNCLDVNRKV